MQNGQEDHLKHHRREHIPRHKSYFYKGPTFFPSVAAVQDGIPASFPECSELFAANAYLLFDSH
ncbi:hypothetical protein AD951_10350 [Acetobacter malorum]|uniref:Uncharacterized protein n=1 Tax=Acetobacter malorum TaxID=178901 RepID=A0A149UL38_9PROT|nr:hypothetical protein AD951_10350 [Acetobacter malorum]